ncbi:hypothetical protein Tco_0920754 [Tanacetum coccineum]
MLVWILGSKFVERASVLHQPDGIRSQRHHIVPYGELNGVSIALVARFGVISKSTDRIFVSHGATMLKTSNGETPFSLTYGSEAVIPAEIGMPMFWSIQFNEARNEEEIRLNLDLIQERREMAAI